MRSKRRVRAAVACAVLWIAGGGRSHADDGLVVHAHAEAPEPLLHLDPELAPPILETFQAVQDVERTVVDLSSRATAVVTSVAWADANGPMPEGVATEPLAARGWHTGLQLSYDLGAGIHLVAFGGTGAIESRFGSGTFFNYGLALVRLFHLSRWTTAWLSLGVEDVTWTGAGRGGAAMMLRAGFTFR